jgi:hypothetical protein
MDAMTDVIRARVPRAWKLTVEREAKRRGITVSAMIREGIEAMIHAGDREALQ